MDHLVSQGLRIHPVTAEESYSSAGFTSILANILDSATGIFPAVTRPMFVPGAPSACRADRLLVPPFRATKLSITDPSRLANKATIIATSLVREACTPFSTARHKSTLSDLSIDNLPPPKFMITDWDLNAPQKVSRVCSPGNKGISGCYIVENHRTKYEFCGLLGHGATSEVILALVSYPGSREQGYVAVKTFNILSALKKHGLSARSKRRKSRKMIPTARSINAEVQTLRRLSESNNNRGFFTPLLAAFHDKDNVYLVMRMYPENLWDRLSFLSQQLGLRLSDHRVSFRINARPFLAFCLDSLHTEHRILHCDFKPQNMLIGPSGHLCIADFGLSIHCFDGPDMRAFMVPKSGTPRYWSPECRDTNVKHVNGVKCFMSCSKALGRQVNKGVDEGDGTMALDGLSSAAVSDRKGADLIKQIISVNPALRAPLSHLKNHEFFSGMSECEGITRATAQAQIGDPGKLALDVEGFISQLDFDYTCSDSHRFDPLHDGSQR
ncbi:kinase-like domain-containing protein [Mycena leptocephala]|nr:kinase-like domain-containing protein [Mycena leptocephala]